MDATTLFLKGIFVGFIIAAPVGPVGIMCIHRAIAQGKLAGYISGLGAALADTVFGAIAAFGVGFLLGPLVDYSNWLRLGGGILLCLLGLRSLLARKVPPPATRDREKLVSDFASAFAVTLTNPITIVSFAAIFASINIPHVADTPRLGVLLCIGVFAGAATWWFLLTLVASLFHGRVAERGVLWITRISGGIIVFFGALLLLSLFGSGDTVLERQIEKNIFQRQETIQP
jgi:threonine/homoserine/homoserine lactone efflux protein